MNVKRDKAGRRRLPKYQVEMAGIYWVAAQLCNCGLVPTILPRNAPRIDMPVTDLEGRVHATIQVKTRSDRQGWMVGWYEDGIQVHAGPHHFFAFVDLSVEPMSALLIPSRIVKKLCEGEAHQWARKRTRLGRKRKSFPVSLKLNQHPSLERYRNRWDLVGGSRRHVR